MAGAYSGIRRAYIPPAGTGESDIPSMKNNLRISLLDKGLGQYAQITCA